MAGLSSILSGVSARAMSFIGFGGSPYEAGRHDRPETAGWHPRSTHAESSWAWGNDPLQDRVDDLGRNNSWIQGFRDRNAERVIGTGLKPFPTPIYLAFGKDYAWGAKWGEALLVRYREWAEDPGHRCDANMRRSLGELEALAFDTFESTGEVLLEIRQDERGSSNPINLMLIDTKRIKNPSTVSPNDPRIRNGIEYVGTVPVAAWICPFHPDDTRSDKGMNEPVRVPFRTNTGTPALVLISKTRFIEQVRGVSPLAAAMTTAKQLDELEKDVANRARLEANSGAFLKSPGTPEDVSEAIAPGSTSSSSNAFIDFFNWREKNPMKALGAMFMRHLYPDEDIVFTPTVTPGPNYAPLRRSMLAKMAAALGGTLPEISQDHEGINLSNARSIENNRYRTVLRTREFWAQQFRMAIHVRWMEWEVAMGHIKIPGGPAKFYTRMAAITNTTWFGPDRGTIDGLKEAEARNREVAAGRKSSIRLMLEDGYYPSEVWDQQAYEKSERDRRNLPATDLNTKGGQSGGDAADSGGAGDPADRDGDGVPNEAAKRKTGKPSGGTEQ